MARRSLTGSIGHAWRAPRAAMAAQIAEGLDDVRALFHLMLACGLYFLASLPNALREAQVLDIDDPRSGAIAAHLFGYLILAPLLAYGAAALVHLLARAFGGRGGFLAARSAVFWSLLLGTPIALGLSLLGVVVEVGGAAALLPSLSLLGYAGLAFWFWLFSASLAEAEGFSATLRVAAVVGAAFIGVVAGLTMLSAGSGAAG